MTSVEIAVGLEIVRLNLVDLIGVGAVLGIMIYGLKYAYDRLIKKKSGAGS
jgi:hypothetical protein